ncbi:MAG: hypothetical protein FWC23_10680 [Chitinispirillia bacterium]|nr:hypothetical protein [Chitinispirillia bacterium]MCL2269632.1 hypothetical protein [Chitinispirillia bacterium]
MGTNNEITAREDRLRRLQAGIVPTGNHISGSKPALSPQAALVLSGVRKSNNASQLNSLPPRRATLSDKAADLIAMVMKDLLRS